MGYNHKTIDKKWQDKWLKEKTFKTPENPQPDKKLYVLDMFPYPSGAGLHVGHPEGYIATDIFCRYKRLNGFDILHPMGWDAFGLPAENYAIQSGIHPRVSTEKNIKTFKRQINSFGFSYDWEREINTADPGYYQWTQWLFLKLYEKDLAYRKKAPVNWCENCQTVLANEQVIGGKCERCSHYVSQKELTQWFFKITDFAGRLNKNIDQLDWPAAIKLMQKNWIGESQGTLIKFPISNFSAKGGSFGQFSIEVFTTRVDTIFGATYLVLAPEHKIIKNLKLKIENLDEVEEYIEKTKKKTELERIAGTEKDQPKAGPPWAEKTGVELKGVKAINPANGQEIPIFIADYVLMGYGTGAIMAVPAHDKRDYEFAQKYHLPIVKVVAGDDDDKECFEDYGRLINSAEFSKLKSKEAIIKITEKLKGKSTIQYKLRDWLVSRQRYWGAPIPIIYCQKCGEVAVPEKDLPVLLPDDVDFKPTGESPLKYSKTFQNVKCPLCGASAKRESDTMDTFVDSSWYFLRYCDPDNKEEFAGASEVKKWLPVDIYVGGAEHAVMHLLYARFFNMFLFDQNLSASEEPFTKLINQGLILGADGQKMSKSRGNVINPDEVIDEYGADTFRMYEMFMGPLEDSKPWSTEGIKGIRRFLEKVCRLNTKPTGKAGQQNLVNQTIKKITKDIENFRFNTAISALMILLNEFEKNEVSKDDFITFLILLSPFAPHLSSELLESLDVDLTKITWPKAREIDEQNQKINLPISINGKFKTTIIISAGDNEEKIKETVSSHQTIKNALEGKKIAKWIIVPLKIINIVVK